MMQLLPKSHEQRIAELEAQVRHLLQIVGVPGPLSGLAGLPNMQGPNNLSNEQSQNQNMASIINRGSIASAR